VQINTVNQSDAINYDYFQELILDLHVKIIVNQDGSLTINEAILINAQHQAIKRGITRSFPTRYKSRLGYTVVVDFEVKEVLLDNQPCHYEITKASNGKIVHFGTNQFINKGLHLYQITYNTNRQLTFGKNWTELYFNIVGNDVIFPILKASADIYLPTNIPPEKIDLYGYTGFYGAQLDHYQAWVKPGNICHFETTKSLRPHQSFTVSAAFPASLGVITPPSFLTKLNWFVKDNLDLLILLLCILILILLYGHAWFKIQKDKPVIMPLFTPPNNMLPADCLFLYSQNFSNTAVTATIVDMAIKGYLKIKHVPGNLLTTANYTLIKNQEAPLVENPKYDNLAKILFDKKSEVKLDSSNSQIIIKLLDRIKFITNTNGSYIIDAINGIDLQCGISISLMAFIGAAYWYQSDYFILFIIIIFGINMLAAHYLKTYTPEGKELYAKITGFRMYLSYAEKDRIERLNPPTITHELFEKYLPYAIALGVDQAWSNYFNHIYINLAQNSYQPNWFIGRRFNFNNFNSDLRNFNYSLNNAITAPVRAPGSYSGRGGSGFSGGGGGGGGIGGR